MGDKIDSTSDERVTNNVMRHEYKKLSELEKAHMRAIKDKGLEFHTLLDDLQNKVSTKDRENYHSQGMELHIAKQKVEEAVMWAVKHITK